MVIGIAINRIDRIYICGLNTKLDNFEAQTQKGINTISLRFKKLPLSAGNYYLVVGLFDKSVMVMWDLKDFAKEFTVTSPCHGKGVVFLEHDWEYRPIAKGRDE